MKTVVEIRIFSIEQAIKLLGVGTSDKTVVEKAKEIESYILSKQETSIKDVPSMSMAKKIDKEDV